MLSDEWGAHAVIHSIHTLCMLKTYFFDSARRSKAPRKRISKSLKMEHSIEEDVRAVYHSIRRVAVVGPLSFVILVCGHKSSHHEDDLDEMMTRG